VPEAKAPKLWSGKIVTDRMEITGPPKRARKAD